MAHLHKVLLILTLLFLAVDARHKRHHTIRDRLLLPRIPFLHDYFEAEHSNDDDGGNSPIFEDEKHPGGILEGKKSDFEIDSIGNWELINQESGVSAMHINLLPTNKLLVYDAKVYRTSRIKLPEGVPCVPYKDDKTKEEKQDCFAHAMEYDIETNEVRPLKVCINYFLRKISLFFVCVFTPSDYGQKNWIKWH